jgi:Outer membrane efflux protein.
MVSVQLTFDLPIFAQKRQNPQIAVRQQELERVSAERETMVRQHTVELETMLAEQASLTHQIDRIDQEWLPLNQEKLQVALAAYSAGREPLTTVLESRRALLETHMKRIDLEERRAATETGLRYLSEEVQQ